MHTDYVHTSYECVCHEYIVHGKAIKGNTEYVLSHIKIIFKKWTDAIELIG